MKQLPWILALSFTLTAAACGGGSDGKKKLGPKDPKGLAQKPSNATPMGKATSIKPKSGGPTISTMQPGDTGDDMFCWQEDIDENGTDDDCCVVEDDETGDIALACSPFQDTCDGGEDFSAALVLVLQASGEGTFAVAGSNICGSGIDLFGCDFDADGEIGACGACTVSGTEVVCEDSEDEFPDEEEEEEEEEEDEEE